jgi:hypothetical protein
MIQVKSSIIPTITSIGASKHPALALERFGRAVRRFASTPEKFSV